MLLCHQYGVCGHIGCRIHSYFGCLATLCFLIHFIILEFNRHTVTLIQAYFFFIIITVIIIITYHKIITLTSKLDGENEINALAIYTIQLQIYIDVHSV